MSGFYIPCLTACGRDDKVWKIVIMENETKSEYCLFISSKILEDNTEKLGGVTRYNYTVKAKILRLSEDEIENEVPIEHVRRDRPFEEITVVMSDHPDTVKNEVHELKSHHGTPYLSIVLKLKSVTY